MAERGIGRGTVASVGPPKVARTVPRDEARVRARGPRRFHPIDDEQTPPPGHYYGPRRRRGMPDQRPEWPFLMLLVVPWLMWLTSIVLEHYEVCLLCMRADVTIAP